LYLTHFTLSKHTDFLNFGRRLGVRHANTQAIDRNDTGGDGK
jgi:hypothetical protein